MPHEDQAHIQSSSASHQAEPVLPATPFHGETETGPVNIDQVDDVRLNVLLEQWRLEGSTEEFSVPGFTIEDSEFGSMHKIVQHLETYPFDAPWLKTPEKSGSRSAFNSLEYEHNRCHSALEQGGMYPLFRDADDSLWLGINVVGRSGDLRTRDEIATNLFNVVDKLKLDETKLKLLFLGANEFRELSDMAKNPEKGLHYLQKITADTEATHAYYRIIDKAIARRASDIHFEPHGDAYRVRYRIDGDLQVLYPRLSTDQIKRIFGVIKIKSALNVAESRRPQDGAISFTSEELLANEHYQGYTLRVASTPELTTGNVLREKFVLRLLNARSGAGLSFSEMGFPKEQIEIIERELRSPKGVVLVTGPTGHGKTTTLYAMLRKLNTPHVNIQTIEDPVEILIPGINQAAVDKAIELSFAQALRAYLRQDPDIILVGEIRDEETADVAFKAAETGHLVFSTLHTNDAISTLRRLQSLGLNRDMIQSTLNAIIAQRLVRTACDDCKERYNAKDAMNELLGEDLIHFPLYLYRAKEERNSCASCEGRGYKGRTSVAEIWQVGREERDLISQGISTYEPYLNAALQKGFRPLVVSGIAAVLNGKTTLKELESVSKLSEFFELRHVIKQFIDEHPPAEVVRQGIH